MSFGSDGPAAGSALLDFPRATDALGLAEAHHVARHRPRVYWILLDTFQSLIMKTATSQNLQSNSTPPTLAECTVSRHLYCFGKCLRSHSETGQRATRDTDHQWQETSTHKRETRAQDGRHVCGTLAEERRVFAGNVRCLGIFDSARADRALAVVSP